MISEQSAERSEPTPPVEVVDNAELEAPTDEKFVFVPRVTKHEDGTETTRVEKWRLTGKFDEDTGKPLAESLVPEEKDGEFGIVQKGLSESTLNPDRQAELAEQLEAVERSTGHETLEAVGLDEPMPEENSQVDVETLPRETVAEIVAQAKEAESAEQPVIEPVVVETAEPEVAAQVETEPAVQSELPEEAQEGATAEPEPEPEPEKEAEPEVEKEKASELLSELQGLREQLAQSAQAQVGVIEKDMSAIRSHINRGMSAIDEGRNTLRRVMNGSMSGARAFEEIHGALRYLTNDLNGFDQAFDEIDTATAKLSEHTTYTKQQIATKQEEKAATTPLDPKEADFSEQFTGALKKLGVAQDDMDVPLKLIKSRTQDTRDSVSRVIGRLNSYGGNMGPDEAQDLSRLLGSLLENDYGDLASTISRSQGSVQDLRQAARMW